MLKASGIICIIAGIFEYLLQVQPCYLGEWAQLLMLMAQIQ